ncbi:DUF1120 domain-containing protein [Lysobacter sp. A6]|uniref:DUF1120 domain-containing protein n=1 Tax=Noviluteimonas lactosilytica TaxID=2888523 RepID=A0ABS8JGT5_9GAMM|nr:DUF1120 domain-containing protein [Lysobacter lactosilyticus]MCC8362797.1 DUF1120 domain-containing protein [Lysobacter lactosilyticus]
MLVLAAAMALPVGACAAEADTMSVTGRIVEEGGCNTSIQNGGNVDYGIIPASSLDEYDVTQMDLKTLGVSIACASPTYIALSIHDKWTGDSGDSYLSLGMAAPYEPIGYYQVRHAEAVTVNGSAGYMVNDPAPGPSPGAFWYSAFHVDPWAEETEWRSFAYVSEGAAVAQPITSAQFTLHILATIRELWALQLSGALPLDGQFTIEMMYM